MPATVSLTLMDSLRVNHCTSIKAIQAQNNCLCKSYFYAINNDMDYIEKLQVLRRRDKRIQAMLKNKTQAEVAVIFGLTQQRVAQIAKRIKKHNGGTERIG